MAYVGLVQGQGGERTKQKTNPSLLLAIVPAWEEAISDAETKRLELLSGKDRHFHHIPRLAYNEGLW